MGSEEGSQLRTVGSEEGSLPHSVELITQQPLLSPAIDGGGSRGAISPPATKLHSKGGGFLRSMFRGCLFPSAKKWDTVSGVE